MNVINAICIAFILMIIINIAGVMAHHKRMKLENHLTEQVKSYDSIKQDVIDIMIEEQETINIEVQLMNKKVGKIIDGINRIDGMISANEEYDDDKSIQTSLYNIKNIELHENKDRLLEQYCSLNKKKINLMNKSNKITLALTKKD